MPIHESQEIPHAPTGPQLPLSPTTAPSPAPFVRLGGAIAPSDVPVVREAKGPGVLVPSGTMQARTGLRKTGGPRKGPPPPVPQRIGEDPELAAKMAKRRAWEAVEVEGDGGDSVTPSQSASNVDLALSEEEASMLSARRLAKEDFDTKRKTGWKKDN
ncbi:hypothetical protein BDW02DRAFT_571136, partial [Decorospora gaudefroyi]